MTQPLGSNRSDEEYADLVLFGNNLLKHRVQLHLNKKDMAIRLGCSDSCVNDIENARGTLRASTYHKIVRVTGITCDMLTAKHGLPAAPVAPTATEVITAPVPTAAPESPPLTSDHYRQQPLIRADMPTLNPIQPPPNSLRRNDTKLLEQLFNTVASDLRSLATLSVSYTNGKYTVELRMGDKVLPDDGKGEGDTLTLAVRQLAEARKVPLYG